MLNALPVLHWMPSSPCILECMLNCLLWYTPLKVLAGVISAVKKAADRGGMGSTNIVRPSVYHSPVMCCLPLMPEM